MTVLQDVTEPQGLVARGKVHRREGSSDVAAYSPYVQPWSVLWQTELQGIYARPLYLVSMLPEGSQNVMRVCPPFSVWQGAGLEFQRFCGNLTDFQDSGRRGEFRAKRFF